MHTNGLAFSAEHRKTHVRRWILTRDVRSDLVESVGIPGVVKSTCRGPAAPQLPVKRSFARVDGQDRRKELLYCRRLFPNSLRPSSQLEAQRPEDVA